MINKSEDFTYDIECFPNFFSLCAVLDSGKEFEFEISEWKDDRLELYRFLLGIKEFNHRMVGFNNLSYDYMLIHYFLDSCGVMNYQELYYYSQAYFIQGKGVRFNPMVIAEWNQLIPQVDLFKIHHFDNANKRTSLKMIEFNMRSNDIKDLPFDPLESLTYLESRVLLKYNKHDVSETHKFKIYSQDMINFRDELSIKHKKNFTNFSDSKMGSTFFEMALQNKGIKKKVDGQLNQTLREEIKISEVLLPYISFEKEEFKKIHEFFKTSIIDTIGDDGLLFLKGFFKGLSCSINNFSYDFGAGGIHGSVKKKVFKSNETHVILDWDVASFYPNLSIKNNFYPEHLTEEFCNIYLSIYNERKKHGKKTSINAMLKLALNSVYGNSSSGFSMMLDQKFTISITVNGQLLLCMLAEQLLKIPNLEMIQVNTDGLTILCPREYREHANKIWKWWEKLTKLELEEAEYKSMYVFNVNNYIAEYSNGNIKRIGCYASELSMDNVSTRELAWHKNQGARVVSLAAESALVKGTSIKKFIKSHTNYFDFMMRTKVDNNSKLILRKDNQDLVLQKICRYHASESGGQLIKIMPHTKVQLKNWDEGNHYQHEDTLEYQVTKVDGKPRSGKYKPVSSIGEIPPREIKIESGVNCCDCSSMNDFNPENINFDYYIKEAQKIVNPILLGV